MHAGNGLLVGGKPLIPVVLSEGACAQGGKQYLGCTASVGGAASPALGHTVKVDAVIAEITINLVLAFPYLLNSPRGAGGSTTITSDTFIGDDISHGRPLIKNYGSLLPRSVPIDR